MKFWPHSDGKIHHKVVLTLSWILIASWWSSKVFVFEKVSCYIKCRPSDGTLWWPKTLKYLAPQIMRLSKN